jgi:hypothetical protein
MWDDEAASLANILGYDIEEWYYDYIGEDTTVEILKSAVEDPSDNKVEKETYESLKKARVEFGKLHRQYQKEKENAMANEGNVDLQKSIDDAVQAALKKEREKNEVELQKAKDELTELKKTAEKKEKEEMVELCKGYSFVEDAEKLSDALFLCKSVSGFDVILDTLEKARTAIKAALEKEIGTDEERQIDPVKGTDLQKSIDKTTEILKARKEGK